MPLEFPYGFLTTWVAYTEHTLTFIMACYRAGQIRPDRTLPNGTECHEAEGGRSGMMWWTAPARGDESP
jgi:hypothetical protein